MQTVPLRAPFRLDFAIAVCMGGRFKHIVVYGTLKTLRQHTDTMAITERRQRHGLTEKIDRQEPEKEVDEKLAARLFKEAKPVFDRLAD